MAVETAPLAWLREIKTRKSPVRGKQSDPVRKEQTMEVVREEKKLLFCPWMNNNRKDANWKCVSLQHSRGKIRIAFVSDDNHFFPAIVKSTRVECACG